MGTPRATRKAGGASLIGNGAWQREAGAGVRGGDAESAPLCRRSRLPLPRGCHSLLLANGTDDRPRVWYFLGCVAPKRAR